MSAEKNIELICKMYEALNRHDAEAQDEFWHEDMIWHGPPGFGDIHGRDNFKYKVLKPFWSAFPDYYVKDDIQVANDDWASATGFLTGTHQGEFIGIPPTGKPVKMRYSDFWLVKDGKLAENWVMTDDLSVLRQIGVESLKGIDQAG